MKIQLFLIGVLVFLVSSIGFAQKRTDINKQLAREQINQLHNGVLLVRLQTKKKSIEALKKRGQLKLAGEIKAKQESLNKEIVSAFQRNFDFCPTYFFYSNYSQEIIDKSFEEIQFLDKNLLPDTKIKFDNKSFLTAEFGTIEQDTTNRVPVNNGAEKQEQKYSGSNMGFGALIIKSEQFNQLKKPFPFYVRTYDSLPIKRKPRVVVRKMNEKLHEFLNYGR